MEPSLHEWMHCGLQRPAGGCASLDAPYACMPSRRGSSLKVFAGLPKLTQAQRVAVRLRELLHALQGGWQACLSLCLHFVQNERALKVFVGRLTPESIPAGHDICKEGDDADCLWLLQEGEQQGCSCQRWLKQSLCNPPGL